MIDGNVNPGKVSLGGCYIDSGVNALSVCDRLAPLNEFRLAHYSELRDDTPDKTVYHAKHVFKSDDCDLVINTAWDNGLNSKKTMLELQDTTCSIELDHSKQSVILLSEYGQKVLYHYDEGERLVTQYLGVFNDFYNALQSGVSNRDHAVAVHRLLLTGNM